ncbi:MAG: hypothetical protein AMJ46_05120 [Latescibacteria bacterium DG_63]|nr:MAG: hypothetical protein AMJ46_05120 [Latescibacteria bacterium DG_63]
MPRGDRTGPLGAGPMTGRAAGLCAGYPTPGYMNPIGGGWFGRGRGWFGGGRGGWGGRGWGGGGRGWRHRFWATGVPGWGVGGYGYPAFAGWPYPLMSEPTAGEEMEFLKEQAEALKEELKEIEKRLDTVKKAQAQEKAQK